MGNPCAWPAKPRALPTRTLEPRDDALTNPLSFELRQRREDVKL